MLIKPTLMLWTFGLTKVPMIFWVRPRVWVLDDEQASIYIPLTRRTKNHLNSMYFGALSLGADVAGGIHLIRFSKRHKEKLSFVFKDFKADFLKRPEAGVLFTNKDGLMVESTIQRAIETKERENTTVRIQATTPSISESELVASFELTLSVKVKK